MYIYIYIYIYIYTYIYIFILLFLICSFFIYFLTNCSWCRTHLHALLLSPGNWTTSSHRSRLHWLPIRQRVDFKVGLLTYSIRYSCEPQRLNSLLMDYKPTRCLVSAEEHLLVVPRTKLSSTSRAFSVAAPKLLNNLH